MYDLFRTEVRETQDDGDQQTVTLYGVGGEELSKVHRVQQFGLSSTAPVGSHGIGMALHGRRDLVVSLGLENAQYRPRNTAPGGTILYDMFGSAVSLVQSNLRIVHAQKIEIASNGGGTIVIDGDKVKINS